MLAPGSQPNWRRMAGTEQKATEKATGWDAFLPLSCDRLAVCQKRNLGRPDGFGDGLVSVRVSANWEH